MAELVIKIKRDNRPDPSFQDGDVLHAFSDEIIQARHCQTICRRTIPARDVRGFRPPDSLIELCLAATCEQKLIRTGPQTAKTVNLTTLKETDCSGTMDVGLYFQRRLAEQNSLVFGSPGAEHSYSRRTSLALPRIDSLWQEIEKRTPYRKADHRRFGASEKELANYLFLTVHNFTALQKLSIEEGESEERAVDDKGPVRTVTKRRRRAVRWRDLPGVYWYTVRDVLDITKKVEFRGAGTFATTDFVEVKN